MCGENQERDERRARFTAWMEVIALRTRRRYLNGRDKRTWTPLEEAPSEFLVKEDAVDFEEQRLSDAFAGLPERKRRILTMLFVLEMEPEEIGKELDCTVQNVYNQRSLALIRLREALNGGEAHD